MNARKIVLASAAGIATAYLAQITVGGQAMDAAGKALFFRNKLTGPVPLAVFAAAAGVGVAWLFKL